LRPPRKRHEKVIDGDLIVPGAEGQRRAGALEDDAGDARLLERFAQRSDWRLLAGLDVPLWQNPDTRILFRTHEQYAADSALFPNDDRTCLLNRSHGAKSDSTTKTRSARSI